MRYLRDEIKAKANENLSNNLTIKQFNKRIDRFADFAKNEGITKTKQAGDLDQRCALVQKYIESMKSEGLSAQTIHAYLVPVCKGLGIKPDKPGGKWQGIEAPARRQIEITKGRTDLEVRSLRDLENPKFARLVEFQKAVGLRRAELARLTPDAIQHDITGALCIIVKGKGGKIQHQRILPADEKIVFETIAGKRSGERIFSSEEMKNKINLHSLRRNRAQSAYEHYLREIHAGRAEALKTQIRAVFDEYNPKATHAQRVRFARDLDEHAEYVVRGDGVTRALADHRPVRYNRLAALAVSVFHLAHWRIDVTITNYLL